LVRKGNPLAKKPLKLGEILVRAGIVDEEQVRKALQYKKEHGGPLGAAMIALGYLSEENLLSVLAHQLKLSRIRLEDREIPADILTMLPAEKAREYNVLPVDRKEMHGTAYLLVAMSDPTNLMVIDDIQFITDCRVRPTLATDAEIEAAVLRCYKISSAVETVKAEVPSDAIQGNYVTQEKYRRLLLFLKGRGILSDQEFEHLK